MTHDYLIVCIRPQHPDALSGLSRMWARCERNPGSVRGGIAKLSRQAAPAVDTMKFSVDRSKLTDEGDVAIMMSAYDSLHFEHVMDLLRTIHAVSPK